MFGLFLKSSVVLAALAAASPAVSHENNAKAWIELDKKDGKAQMRSMAEWPMDATLKYKLTLEKKSASGRSSTSQGGTVQSSAGEAVQLSVSSVDYASGTEVIASLTVTGPGGHEVTDEINLTAASPED